jgi:hypothetical protein
MSTLTLFHWTASNTYQQDMSNYWTPQLYVKFKNGTFMPVPEVGDLEDVTGGMTAYYLQRRGDDHNEKLHAFPEGFRMIAGDPFTRSFGNNSAAKAISYSCLGGPNLPETNNMPNYNCPGGLRAQVFFPSCWNGKDVDTPDHKSHMSYPVGQEYNNGACPPDFPVHMISLFYEVLYDTSRFLDQWEGDQHPFVFSNGDATGYGLHGDFVNGWDIDVLQRAVDECTDDSGQVEKCPVLTQFTGQECQECRLPEQIDEVNDGHLEKLPGCNPVTGPGARAVPQQCNDGVKLGVKQTNYVDLTASKKWEYVGCGRDNIGDRALTGPSWSRDNTTVESCVDFCSKEGFSYAGLENKGECFCGDKLNEKYAPRDGFMGACVMKCTGNQDQVCGGWAAMSVYHACPDNGPCANNEEFGKAAATTAKVQRAAIEAPVVLKKKVRRHPREMVVA